LSTLPRTSERLHQSLDERTLELLEHRRDSPTFKRRGWLMRRMLLASDLAGLVLAFATAQLIFDTPTRSGNVGTVGEWILFVASLPLWVVMVKLYGLYDRDEERADHSTADDVVGVFHLVTVGTWLLFAGAYVTHLANPQLPKLLTFWALAAAGIPLLRTAARARCRRSLHYVQNTIVLGAGEVGQRVARKVLRHPEYGINLVGFVDGLPMERGDELAHLTVLGDVEDVPELVRVLDIERVIVAFSHDHDDRLVTLVRELNQLDVQVDVVPRFYDVMSPAVDIHGVEGLPLIGLRPPRLSSSSAFLKRGLDVAGAALGLVLFAPLMAVIAVAIKREARGPVLFQQVRMGEGDRTFRIVKFRTMDADADARKGALAHLNKHAGDGDPRMFKIDDDPRVTRVGRWLRKFSLDELPQLWNVLRGEMSLVGPRPLVLDEHAYVQDWEGRRLDLKPGITGLWQVLGRDDIPFEEMVKLDYQYVTSWSLGGDLRLILRTIPVAVKGASV
jgi:exopolysaccharide biosynthesis polyprenyl glycosylphosphotransferase